MSKSKKTTPKRPSAIQFRERRFSDIKPDLEHPHNERLHQDTLPLPFGGQVKKDDMREKGLIQ